MSVWKYLLVTFYDVLGSIPARRLFHIITFNNNGHFRTLAMGGVDDDNNVLNTVEEWEPESESWSTVETRLKEKRNVFGLVAVNKNLVCPSE